MDKMKDVALLAGRILLALMFVMAGWGKIGGYAGTQGYMEAMGVPGFMLPLVILLELGGGLAIVLGLFTRSLSVLLAGFTCARTPPPGGSRHNPRTTALRMRLSWAIRPIRARPGSP